MNQGIHRRIVLEVTPDLVKRFWAKVEKRGDDECWLWTASTRANYGCIKHRGKLYSAHCVAWILANGRQIPEGNVVRHSCDVQACCNPAHLLLGTPADNIQDMRDRGLARYVKGEEVPGAVLTESVVRQIREMKRNEGLGAIRISRALGLECHLEAVKGVLEGSTWKHVG